jgi:hypothetical protein
VHQAQHLGACVGIHLEHLIKLAHLEEEDRVVIARLEVPPAAHSFQSACCDTSIKYEPVINGPMDLGSIEFGFCDH